MRFLANSRKDKPGGREPPAQELRDRPVAAGPQPPGGPLRYGLLWALVLALAFWAWSGGQQAPRVEPIAYTTFKQAVEQGRVSEVVLRGHQVLGTYAGAGSGKGQAEIGAEAPATSEPRRFSTAVPEVGDPALLELLEANEVTVRVEPAEAPWWMRILVGVLPWILLLGLLFYLSYRMQRRLLQGGGGPGGLFGFGGSRAKRVQKKESSVTFADVAGLENARRDLTEIVEYLKDPERYRALGAKVPRGILLTGPPGCGKTLLARAVAGEAEVAFFHVSGSEFIEMFVGVGASRVRHMFDDAKKAAPAIVFIDEIDAIGRTRGSGVGGGHDEREQTLNQILSEMDGFEPHQSVVVIAATNRPDVLDPALLRPGRFDRKVTVDLPGKSARRHILEVHTRKVPLADDVDLDTLASRTIGFSGADLENLVNEAALLAGRRERREVDARAFEQARDKILFGPRREEMLSDEERRIVAHHEAGHTLVAHLLAHADKPEKVTIIPRGRALGATQATPDEDRYHLRESYLRDRLAVMLGGRVAERLVFGEVSSGAENDLKEATRLARRMIAHWGMSERLGPVAYQSGEEHVFLGRELAQQRDFSEHMARAIDEEIGKLLGETEATVEKLLGERRTSLEALARRLLEEETLEAERIAAVVEAPEAA